MAEAPVTADTELQLGKNANAIAAALHGRRTCHPIKVGKFCPSVRAVLRQTPVSNSSTRTAEGWGFDFERRASGNSAVLLNLQQLFAKRF